MTMIPTIWILQAYQHGVIMTESTYMILIMMMDLNKRRICYGYMMSTLQGTCLYCEKNMGTTR